MTSREFRPTPRTLAGDTPNPGALEMSLADVLMPTLAVFSVARGLGNLIAPPSDHISSQGLARMLGSGEVAVGLGIAMSAKKQPWLLARAGLDALEGADRVRGGGGPVSVGRRVASVLVDLYAARALAPAAEARASQRVKPAEISRTVTIQRPADELHRLARDPEVIKQSWAAVADVEDVDEGRARFDMKGVRFEVRLGDDRPGERIAWTAEGMGARMDGAVAFSAAPGGRGTETRFTMRLPREWRTIAAPALQALRLAPEMIVYSALQRFKAIAETGEAPRLKPLPHGKR